MWGIIVFIIARIIEIEIVIVIEVVIVIVMVIIVSQIGQRVLLFDPAP